MEPNRYRRIQPLLLIILALLLATTLYGFTAYSQEDKRDLGARYCGIQAEKKYGIVEGVEPDRTVGPKVYYIKVEGIIDYAMAEYIDNAISIAEDEDAILVVTLNTPGGLVDAALEIVSSISKAEIPVIGYVVDKWAESAGTLILMSTHIAAMQPGTIIGSVQPVAYNPATGSYEPVNESKIINPIIEVFCEHGATKGRNATALVRFVLHNDNYGAEEALRYNVIEIVARNMNDLLSQVNGKIVALPSGDAVKIDTNNPDIAEIPPSVRVTVLHTLSDPLLAGILLSLGTLILLFSLASGHPGGAGVGALLLLLGLAGSGFNPNLTSLLLILGGSILIFIEIYTPGFGIIGGTGIVMLVLGIALLPVSGGQGFSISPAYADQLLGALYATGGFIGAVTAFMVYKVIQVRKKKPILWTIIGAKGRAIDKIEPGKPGFVIVEGEYWKAESEETINPGDPVVVVDKEEHILKVRKAEE